jgi:hypothetical protein
MNCDYLACCCTSVCPLLWRYRGRRGGCCWPAAGARGAASAAVAVAVPAATVFMVITIVTMSSHGLLIAFPSPDAGVLYAIAGVLSFSPLGSNPVAPLWHSLLKGHWPGKGPPCPRRGSSAS